MNCLDAVLSLDGSLCAKERKKRSIVLFFALAGIVFLVAGVGARMGKPIPAAILAVYITSFVVVLYLLGCVLCKRELSHNLIVTVLYTVSVGFFIVDLNARTVGIQTWPLLVVVVDLFLVLEVPGQYTTGLVAFTVFWLILMAVEESFRFGIFDLPGLNEQHGEFGRRAHFLARMDCETLPCPVNFPPRTLFTALSVFVVDFMATRGFAREVLKEQASMEKTINTVQVIASMLAQYDVEGVASLLTTHEADLPAAMTEALRHLEENLRLYKAYLPMTCLPFPTHEVARGDVFDRGLSCSRSSSLASSLSIQHLVSSPRALALPQLGLSAVKATLLTINIKDTYAILEDGGTHFAALFTMLLQRVIDASESQRGMVDVFVGDRVHCSFNTTRVCANHATSALHAVSAVLGNSMAVDVNMGVATGNVLRGDMGCDGMRRFSMVGPLVRDVHGMERAGRTLGCTVVCNRICFSDAECEHQLRLLPCRVEVDSGCEKEHIAELLETSNDNDPDADEWMYMIGGRSDWDTYNAVVRKYLKGKASAQDVIDAASQGVCAQKPLNVVPGSVKGDLLCLPVRTACTSRYSTLDASVSVVSSHDN